MFLSLLTCVFCWTFCISAREILISENGSETPSCLDELNASPCCRSLVSVSNYVTSRNLSNLVIKIIDTNYTLQGIANFSEVENVTILGQGPTLTHVVCKRKGRSRPGIAFLSSSSIRLQNFAISNCGAHIFNFGDKWNDLIGYFAAIQFNNCSQVVIMNIHVSLSVDQGLTFINTQSKVRIIDSKFTNNSISYGGGIQIIFYNCTRFLLLSADYTIANNLIKHNCASRRKSNWHDHYSGSYYRERGGGIRIIVLDACKNLSFTIHGNRIENNFAFYGGGAQVYVNGHAANNTFHLSNNTFSDNTATWGGGGLDVGISTERPWVHSYPMNNTIMISNSTFSSNQAAFGAGLNIYAGSVGFFEAYANNSFFCANCYFLNNTALGGSAVYVNSDSNQNNGPQPIITITYINCTFEKNAITIKTNTKSESSIGRGAFFVAVVAVKFSGSVYFTENNGTALYLDSTSVNFTDNCTVYFSNNSGYNGGAVLLSGKSNFIVNTSGYFHFSNNEATKLGGAICALSGSEYIYAFMGSCFLRLLNHTNPRYHHNETNLQFVFANNSAAAGDDIFMTSIAPCDKLCGISHYSKFEHFFDKYCFGNFTFTDSQTGHGGKTIATLPASVNTSFENSVLPIVPGIVTHLPIIQNDELGTDVNELFPLTVKVHGLNNNVRVDPSYTIISNNATVLYGSPSSEIGEIWLESDTIRHTIRFSLTFCSPGYVLDSEGRCVCFALHKNRSQFYPLMHCEPNGSAAIDINAWAGYTNISDASQYNLYTGICAAQLCNRKASRSCLLNNQRCSLPQSVRELEKAICGENRRGRLCGRCIQEKVVYYHSKDFTCGSSANCHYGILIYIASELFPVTIIFLVILIFNISLTSGALYSFVFYIQILSRLDITAFDSTTQTVFDVFQVLLGIFSFEVRNGEFCVFHTNSIMHMLAIKYITLAYAFTLVLTTMLVLKVNSCYKCVKLCRQCGRKNIRGSIVDGLSAFLVLCYFQCAVVTSSILTPSYLYNLNAMHYKVVPMFDGKLEYFQGTHLWFALLACLCFAFILIPPPAILILEPILTKLFSLNCCAGTQAAWFYNKLRLKLMPFLDSFQACFKDRHRYFAGLYFIYRLVIPMTNIFVQSPGHYYGYALGIFLVILFLHTLLQPYKKKWHGLLELFLFFNIVSLLILTIYNYYGINKKVITVQLVLMSLSFAYMIIYAVVKIHQQCPLVKISLFCQTSSEEIDDNDDDTAENFPYRLLNQ